MNVLDSLIQVDIGIPVRLHAYSEAALSAPTGRILQLEARIHTPADYSETALHAVNGREA